MIAPWVDSGADIAAINAGEAFYLAFSARIWVNGRLWGMHMEKQAGTLYPIAGDGFFSVSQSQYRAMRIIASYNGINERSEHELAQWPSLTDLDREVARIVWRMRMSALAREDERGISW